MLNSMPGARAVRGAKGMLATGMLNSMPVARAVRGAEGMLALGMLNSMPKASTHYSGRRAML